MTAKHSPATSLPWPGLIPEPNFARQDAAYIVHAANAYPKLVKYIKQLTDPDCFKDVAEEEARALLRELGEAE